MPMPKKVVVIGPESTGKTMLCEQLATHFHTNWVGEYARQYLTEHGMDYRYEDLLTIAKGQIALEEKEIARSASLLFIDTDMYVMKVWCEFVFGKCHHWILDQIVIRKYDLYLLCQPDIPWVGEALREYPDPETREKLFHIYKDCMINQQTRWIQISGPYDQRMKLAVEAVNGLI
jgi:NadR type nicotinamide-nucleotide adenylyltransferase